MDMEASGKQPYEGRSEKFRGLVAHNLPGRIAQLQRLSCWPENGKLGRYEPGRVVVNEMVTSRQVGVFDRNRLSGTLCQVHSLPQTSLHFLKPFSFCTPPKSLFLDLWLRLLVHSAVGF